MLRADGGGCRGRRWLASQLALLAAGITALWLAQVLADATLLTPVATPVVLDRNGAFITQVGRNAAGRVDYGYWPVTPPARVVAVTLALEDRRFWHHPGVDLLAVARAVWQRAAGHGASGASTLAMQVARMQHPRPRTLWAKAVEAGVAVAITARYGHAAVLAQYLTLAPYGQSSHGIGHAAWWYFGRPAQDLSWQQAALLAAVPQSPARLALRRQNPRTVARAMLALDRVGCPARAACDGGSGDMREALRALAPAPRRPDCTALVLRLHARARDRQQGGGPVLRASVDLSMQAAISGVVAQHMRGWRNFGAQQAALLVVRRSTGWVLASVGGVARYPGEAIDFTATLRSPGSALKPFLYAQALDGGMLAADDIMFDLPEQAEGIGNADHDFLGPLMPRQALANSRNVPAAALLRRIGLDAGLANLRTLGLDPGYRPASQFGLGLAIGAMPTTLERLVRAYAALANDGQYRDLRWFEDMPEAAPRRVMSVGAARLVTSFLSDPLARLPTFPRYGASEYPLAVALKTGTSQGYRDAWTVAWSKDYLVGAWVGRPDDGAMAYISGARAAARLAQSVLMGLEHVDRSDFTAGDFAPPPGQVRAELCTGTGRPTACAARLQEYVAPPGGVAELHVRNGRLRIVQPDSNTHFWRNPDAPAALNQLVLRAAAENVAQVTWMVDGAPVATGAPGAPLYWTMVPGRHRFAVRLPLAHVQSAPVSITVD